MVGGSLHLHHKTYERLENELIDDLELVCPDCHKIADAERAAIGYRNAATTRYNSGLRTFAEKKYGEDWDEDYELAQEAYDRWLEKKAEWY